MYFDTIENFAYGEVNERSFSDLQPWCLWINENMSVFTISNEYWSIWCYWKWWSPLVQIMAWQRSGDGSSAKVIRPQVSESYANRTLQWRHNDRDDVSNHQRLDCLLNRLFRPRSKKKIKAPRHWCLGVNSPVTGKLHAQRAGNAANVSIWWRHHECRYFHGIFVPRCTGSCQNVDSRRNQWRKFRHYKINASV